MRLSWNEIRQRAVAFGSSWHDAERERAESQTFWNEFFEVFGIRRRTVAAFEDPVRNLGGTYSFIDLLWPGTLLAEHKSRGESLSRAATQGLRYVRELHSSGRDLDIPAYLVVSDFARIALHDLDDDRSIEFPTSDLHEHIHEFAFIPGYKRIVTDPEDPANIRAAELLAHLKDNLSEGGYPEEDIGRLMVRILFCLFGEDTGLLGQPSAFQLFIENSTKADGSDLGQSLALFFQTLNTPEARRQSNLDEQLVDLPFVNGQLFQGRLPIASFDSTLRNQLLACCRFQWSRLSPAIFGSLFQSIMDAPERRQIGAHYTSERDILRVLGPLFVEDLDDQITRAGTNKRKLSEVHDRLSSIRILDPACGCGNFLVIAYRELRRLELRVLEAMHPPTRTQRLLYVSSELRVDVDQMYGIEQSSWPARIAEVALWLTDHQMNMIVSRRFGHYFARLPLRNSASITVGNALRIDWNDIVPAAQCAFVVGNPPFVGKKARSPDQAQDMRHVFGNRRGAGALDYVCCWYEIASRYMIGAETEVAFVSTNSITQGEQPAALWGSIFGRDQAISFAHRTFPWESEARGRAHVHVVIISLTGSIPKRRIFSYDHHGVALGSDKVRSISPYLVQGPRSAVSSRGTPLYDVPPMQFGSMPNDGGNLLLTDDEKRELTEEEPGANQFIRPLISSRQFLRGIPRWCLWLREATPAQLRGLPAVLRRVSAVRAYRLDSRRQTTRDLASTPALFAEIRQPSGDYILVPRHASERREYFPMAFLDSTSIVSDSCLCVPGASAFHFGVLQSRMHLAWLKYVGGRIRSDYRYSARLVYNNYPWPSTHTARQESSVERHARCVMGARSHYAGTSLEDLYDPLTMPADLRRAHRDLDRSVELCYRRAAFSDDRRRFEFLLDLWVQRTTT